MTPQNVLDKLKTIPKKGSSDEDESEKWPKQAALYLFKPNLHYWCIECHFWKEGGKCALYGPTTNISKTGACGLWVEKASDKEIPFLGTVNKLESGYMERTEGFGCRFCEYYSNKDCSKVDKNSPGDNPGVISPLACCNRFDPK